MQVFSYNNSKCIQFIFFRYWNSFSRVYKIYDFYHIINQVINHNCVVIHIHFTILCIYFPLTIGNNLFAKHRTLSRRKPFIFLSTITWSYYLIIFNVSILFCWGKNNSHLPLLFATIVHFPYSQLFIYHFPCNCINYKLFFILLYHDRKVIHYDWDS